jgi:hypothetical protein
MVVDFLAGEAEHQAALARRPADDEQALFTRLDALLANDCREARAFHERRRKSA